MLAILTTIIGIAAKGKAAKAIAGGMAGIVLSAGAPFLDAFTKGFAAGGVPAVHDLGALAGQIIVGGLVGYLTVWLAPPNKPA